MAREADGGDFAANDPVGGDALFAAPRALSADNPVVENGLGDACPADNNSAGEDPGAQKSTTSPKLNPSKHSEPGSIAVVRPLVAVPHLDRDFEYLIPPEMSADIQFGVAVKVRLGPSDVTGYVVDIRAEAEHTGQLKPLRRLISPRPVLTPEIWHLAQAVAQWCGGAVCDVLRLAIPTRHAAAERAFSAKSDGGDTAHEVSSTPPSTNDPATLPDLTAAENAWGAYVGGHALIRHLAAGDAPGAAWTAAPGMVGAGMIAQSENGAATRTPKPDSPVDWPEAIGALVGATSASGRGSLIVVPDSRDIERVATACRKYLTANTQGDGGAEPSAVGGDPTAESADSSTEGVEHTPQNVEKTRPQLGGEVVILNAEMGPQARYTAFLKALSGQADVVVGTRAAMFAPVKNLGLALWWDDVDSLHAEPRAPYPHVRDVLRIRAEHEGASLISGGWSRSIAVQKYIDEGTLRPVSPLERRSARVVVTGDERSLERDGPAARARIPAEAWRGVREALSHGPVLVQVPRRGYVPSLACTRCRTKAECTKCHGPLEFIDENAAPSCRWCGHSEHVFTCRECGFHRLRSLVIGAGRTAEELGRAFPGVAIKRSGAPDVLDRVGPEPAIVIATPGAEPVADGGYAATMLLDAWALLDRSGLDAAEKALTTWMSAAALTRSHTSGGVVYLCSVPQHTSLPSVNAFVRWAPELFAEREWAERLDVGLPPACRFAAIEGERKTVVDASDHVVNELARQGISVDILGPLAIGRKHTFDRGSAARNSAAAEPARSRLGRPRGRGAATSSQISSEASTQAQGQMPAAEREVRQLIRWSHATDLRIPLTLRAVRAERAAAREKPVTIRLDPLLDGI